MGLRTEDKKIESVQRISVTVIQKLRNRYTNMADWAVTWSSLPVITKVKMSDVFSC